MAAGDTWVVNLPISFKNDVVISLYDNDFGPDTFLGSCTITTTTPQPASIPVSNTNGAEYIVNTVES